MPRQLIQPTQCQQCGKTFKPKNAGGIYCSKACYHVARTGRERGAYLPPLERTCVVCGTVFTVRRRGGYRTITRCSRECQRRGRYRHGAESKLLSPTEAAWMAGFIDGEGSVMLNPRRDAVALRLTASNTHRPTLERFVELSGIGAVIWNAKKESARNKAGGWWLVNGQGAASVLTQLLPFLVTKRRHAEIAVAFEERLRDPALKADRSWQRRAMAEVRALNRRGPAV